MNEQRKEYFQNIAAKSQKLVLEEKLYLNTKLSLDDVAARLVVSRYNLSHAINNYLGKSFLTFINELRLQAALQMMLNPNCPYKSINEIGKHAGFENRSSFYRASQRLTGLTPSELKEKQMKTRE